MDKLRFRCNLKFLISLILVAILMIIYKIIFMQRYITVHKSSGKRDLGVAADYEYQDMIQNINTLSFNGERIIHLDLKGAPPFLSYFQRLFPLLNSLNVTGLLVEYEDVFPYSSKFTHATNTYSNHDIKYFLKLAKKYKLMIIPLIQTFGHMEFMLKMKKFSHLREVLKYPQVVCPSHEETFQFITGMLDEVIALHGNIRYIHIGCDEVYQLGVCARCTSKKTENRWTSEDLFLDHVTKIAKYIRSTYPHITPLMWDDELRGIPLKTLKKFEIGKLVEPVIWWYQPSITFSFAMWETYSEVFPAVWIASSFKGATGPDQILPDIKYHMENHKSWLRIIAKYSYMITFKGIVLTGWQRYDHFAVLCELLPVSIPSMVNSLLVIRGSSFGMMEKPKKVKDVIACGRHYKYSELCQFPGVNLYNAVVAFSKLRKEIDQVIDSSLIKGWLTEYNLQQGYFNPLLTEELSYKVRDCQMSLNRSKETLQMELKEIYDSYTVTEWMQTFVHSYVTKLSGISGILHYVRNIQDWPARPIGVISEKKGN